MIYCLFCRKTTNDVNITPKVTKNKKPYIVMIANLLPPLAHGVFRFIQKRRLLHW